MTLNELKIIYVKCFNAITQNEALNSLANNFNDLLKECNEPVANTVIYAFYRVAIDMKDMPTQWWKDFFRLVLNFTTEIQKEKVEWKEYATDLTKQYSCKSITDLFYRIGERVE